jgi:peptide/nickel transport system substrate-binding protein
MKKSLIALAIATCVAVSAGAQTKGPIADKIIFDVRMDQSIGIKDTAQGKTDVFFYGLDGKTFRAISADDKAKLDVYAIPSGSWSLMLNPIPNKAPYQVNLKDGSTVFNPLAIREVRYAMNWLIDRKKIVDEILLGDGTPMFTPMTPGQPGTYKYNLIAAKLGMSPRGNEKKALADIDAAMTAASKLPENAGKLVKAGQWWTFNGQPVTIKFIIRVDDPTGRLLEGRYVADQIEKAGIKVDRQELDRSKASKLAYYGDPADYAWGIYTEGWGAGATRAWWDVSISQMYAPYYGYMAGGATEGFWNYQNDEIDRLSKKSTNGWFMTADEYWTDNLKATKLGMEEAARVYVCSQVQYYVANKARFNARMLYGLGDGLNDWSLKSADVKPVNGQKVLHCTQFSARGSLFMSSWDPVGTDGFSDTYSSIIQACTDPSTVEAPNNAKDTALRVKWDLKSIQTKIAPGGANQPPVGKIAVAKDAVIYNSNTKKWESGVEYLMKDGKPSYVKNDNIVTYTQEKTNYLYAKWHSGVMQDVSDIMYATAFQYDWATKDGEGDKNFDEAYASQYQSTLAVSKGTALNKDGSFVSYYDFNWPMDLERVAYAGSPVVKAGNPGRGTLVSWEVTEALAKLVTEGSKSGTVYTFSSDASMTEVDVINPKCVADIKAKLQDFIAQKYVPIYITQWCTPDQAVARYKAAIDFIDKNGNAYISNGPYYVSKVDTTANYIEFSAFRDKSYPYTSDYWPKAFKMAYTRIDSVKVPATAKRSADLSINVAVSTVTYPDDTAKASDGATKVSLALQLPDGTEKTYTAKYDGKAGAFTGTIPAKDLGTLKPGAYTVVILTTLGKNDSPAVEPQTIVLF